MATVDRNKYKCGICLHVYTDPRLLQCFHTFCSQCIQSVAAAAVPRPFLCPSCRQSHRLPEGGVQVLQVNFYLDQDTLNRARDADEYSDDDDNDEIPHWMVDELRSVWRGLRPCHIHVGQRQDMFCVKCDVTLCAHCVLLSHKKHDVISIEQAAEKAEKHLQTVKPKLDDIVPTLKRRYDESLSDLKYAEAREREVKADIDGRCHILQQTLKALEDRAIGSLTDVVDLEEQELNDQLSREKSLLADLEKTMGHLKLVLDRQNSWEMVNEARNLKDQEKTYQKLEEKLSSRPKVTVEGPTLRFSSAPDTAAKYIQGFMGTAAMADLARFVQDRTVVAQQLIAEEPGTEVFSLCIDKLGNAAMSYAWRKGSNMAEAQVFDQKGDKVCTLRSAHGKASLSADETCHLTFLTHDHKHLKTFSKRAPALVLSNDLSGEAKVSQFKANWAPRFSSKEETMFSLECPGPHRAFDVDSKRRFLAVVEDVTRENSDRRLLLYCWPKDGAVAPAIPYKTNKKRFQPADVLFYSSGSIEVLLVADEVSDAIHVLSVDSKGGKFVCYLAPNSPLIRQPTALTISDNKVWVACRGRRLLRLELDVNDLKHGCPCSVM